jgi:hypothetical protein
MFVAPRVCFTPGQRSGVCFVPNFYKNETEVPMSAIGTSLCRKMPVVMLDIFLLREKVRLFL